MQYVCCSIHLLYPTTSDIKTATLARQPTSAIIQPTTLDADRDSSQKLTRILFLLKKSSAEGDTADYTQNRIETFR